jgi:hypothetical protein
MRQRGVTLVEILVGVGISTLLILLAATASYQIAKVNSKVSTSIVENRQLLNIVENIRKGVSYYQIHFDDSPEIRNQVLATDKLIYAWSSQILANASECPDCPGRMGYMIQPYREIPGLYLVTVRLTHKEWDTPFKDFVFTVTSK